MPRGSSFAMLRADSRMRRRRELRTTAFPQCFPIAYPTWGYTPSTPGATGVKTARTGPLVARARERCSWPNAALVWILPTVLGGTSGSDGETVAPLEPPRLQYGPACTRRHAFTEAVCLGPLAGVRLIGTLHVNLPFATLARHWPGRNRVRITIWSWASGSGVRPC
jgi:hypothetical protein